MPYRLGCRGRRRLPHPWGPLGLLLRLDVCWTLPPCPRFANAPSSQTDHVARGCRAGAGSGALAMGQRAEASTPRTGHRHGRSPAPQRPVPTNKRFPSSSQPCTAACSLLRPGPLCPHVAMETAIQRPGTSRLPSSLGGLGGGSWDGWWQVLPPLSVQLNARLSQDWHPLPLTQGQVHFYWDLI